VHLGCDGHYGLSWNTRASAPPREARSRGEADCDLYVLLLLLLLLLLLRGCI